MTIQSIQQQMTQFINFVWLSHDNIGSSQSIFANNFENSAIASRRLSYVGRAWHIANSFDRNSQILSY